jgi:LacI family transcriptional regulator
VTLKDVARKAGLSVTQVSRALNDHDDVAESTKALARRVAAELDYVPNLVARRLQDPKAKTGTIGVLLAGETLRFSDPFFGDLLSAMVLQAGRSGYQLQLSTPAVDEPGGLVDPYEQALRHNRVDGFVLVRTLVDDPRVEFLVERDAPFVAFGRPGGAGGFAAVEIGTDGFDSAVEHLRQLGHRRIVCVAEPPQFAMSARRLDSYVAAFDPVAEPASADEEFSISVAGFREADGFEAGLELLKGPDRPTAVVALNDLLALGVMRAASELGLSVPGDVSVIGFDDIDAARLITPSLTTVRFSAAEVGAALIDELVPLMAERSNSHRARYVKPELVVRSSTGPASD